MTSTGTLLSDLDSKSTAPEDQQFVNRILAEMNGGGGGSGGNQIIYPGGGGGGFPSGPGHIINSPNPNTTAPMAMDPATATAHLIGKDAPTPGDFARMMHTGASPQQFGIAPQMAPIPGMPMQMAGQAGAPYQTMANIPMPQLMPAPQSQGWFSGLFKDLGSQFRLPILVAIVIFVTSLPAVNVLIAHYIPYLIRSSGEISMMGQAAKALTGGLLFWILYKVIIPLGSGVF